MESGSNFKYSALRVRKSQAGIYKRTIETLDSNDLPEGDVLVKVLYSGLNYKDALSAFGRPGVTRSYPHTPGIDAAGVVHSSESSDFKSGDEVIVTSYDLGMNTNGGFGQYIRIPSSWIVPLPDKFSLRESMIAGTAGLTAAQGVYNLLEAGQKPEHGPIIVTGARGAVGSYTIALLAHLGFEVVAGVSVIRDDSDRIQSLGASSIVDSTITDDKSGRALLNPQWAGGFDTIGDNTLATLLKSVKYGGNIISVGNIASGNLSTTVYPFIIRGIKLIGVASQDTPMDLRVKLWGLLSDKWKVPNYGSFVSEIGLENLEVSLEKMINKSSRGKVLLNLWR